MRPLLGTFVEIAVADARNDNAVSQAINNAFERIAAIHQQMSLFERNSDLSQLNFASGRWRSLPRDSLRVIKLARALTQQSQHRFNCTVGGELLESGALPRLGDDEFLPRGRADDIKISGSRVRLLRPVYVTLDGIAKGYAIDCAIALLKRAGYANAWVNAGGDLRVIGDLSLPIYLRQLDGEPRALGQLHNAALASSQRKCDPDQDFPAQIVGDEPLLRDEVISVIARFAWRADALTKVALMTPLAQRAADIAQWRAVYWDETTSCAA
jgi:thiamine biosynthesis lipoprotein